MTTLLGLATLLCAVVTSLIFFVLGLEFSKGALFPSTYMKDKITERIIEGLMSVGYYCISIIVLTYPLVVILNKE